MFIRIDNALLNADRIVCVLQPGNANLVRVMFDDDSRVDFYPENNKTVEDLLNIIYTKLEECGV